MASKSSLPKAKWSTPQLQAHIRKEALETHKVIFLEHVKVQMKKRNITTGLVFETLRKGKILLQPELDYNTGDLKCRMEYYVAGKEIKVVVAISDDNPNLVLITAI
jgi:hypothetical protein